ncbi:transposase [Solemya velum gill symbiont]|nr:IS1380 family transposase [Solemya velum gill symbiont]OOY93750.1 transposase [Solemya velum gill symbiont]
MKLKIEQSDTEFYTPVAGLYFVGHAINKQTTLGKSLRKIKKRHGITNIDLIRTYCGLLAQGKSDFDATDNHRHDRWFRQSLGIKQIPSASRLRQRFNEDATELIPLIEDSLPEVLRNLGAPITPLPEKLDKFHHIPLDIDVFPMDNSKTKKEGVQWTYKQFHGYAPIAAYIGAEGWCMGCELRPGSQHSQNDFIGFLRSVLHRSRRLTQAPLLVRLDSGHDAEESRVEISSYKQVDHIIKLNPRSQYTWQDWLPRFEERRAQWHELRPGKEFSTLSIIHEKEYGNQRLVLRIIKRTTDAVGQMFLTPDYELEGWWTTLAEENYSDDEIIALYQDHATSEQFHSEFKTDLDLERLPSGKFDTNDLVMCLGALVYNILRYMGQSCLLGPDAPVRHPAKRRRLKTVMQELIFMAARLLKKSHQHRLRFGCHCPGFKSFHQLLHKHALC